MVAVLEVAHSAQPLTGFGSVLIVGSFLTRSSSTPGPGLGCSGYRLEARRNRIKAGEPCCRVAPERRRGASGYAEECGVLLRVRAPPSGAPCATHGAPATQLACPPWRFRWQTYRKISHSTYSRMRTSSESAKSSGWISASLALSLWTICCDFHSAGAHPRGRASAYGLAIRKRPTGSICFSSDHAARIQIERPVLHNCAPYFTLN